MSEVKKYPIMSIGAFIFNDQNQLFLMESPGWGNKYTCPGGKVDWGETMEEAIRREVKEETGLSIKEVVFHNLYDAIKIKDFVKENAPEHMIFLNAVAQAKNTKVKLDNREGVSYQWKKLEEWLALGEKKLASATLRFIKELKEKRDNDWEAKYKKALADQQNLLKTTANEKQEFYKYATENLLQDILPVYDNLKISIASLKEEDQANPWVEGIKYVIKQFKDVLEANGLTEIETLNKKFDHHTMEAIEGKGETVIKEVKAGYILKGKVISPARVILEDK